MSAFGRMHKATALVPLAVLSAAWTASMAGVGLGSAVAGDEGSGALPDGTTIPAQAIEAPASVSVPGVVAPGVPRGQAAQIVDTASTSGIPSAALAAYQRAEAVINAADTSCELPWQLIAAIGRVESDHGRFGGNVLGDDGVAAARHLRHRAQRHATTPSGSPTPTPGSTTRTRSTTAPSAPCSSSRRPGRSSASTATTTASATPRTSTTPPSPPRSTSARATTTCPPSRASAPASTATTTPTTTSTWCCRSCRPTWTATSRRCRPAPPRPASSSPPRPGPTGPAKDKGRGGKGGQQGNPVAESGTPTATPTKKPTKQPTKTARRPPSSRRSSPPRSPTKTPTTKSPVPVPVPPTLPTLPSTSVPPLDQTLTYVQAVAQCTTQGVVDNPLTATNELANCANALLAP